MASMPDFIDRGLNLSRPDEMDPAEYEAFKDVYVRSKGYALPAFDFWAEHRFDVLKRYRLLARMITTESTLTRPLPNILAFLHYYAIVGYDDGILYEINLARLNGASKATVLSTIAVAFLHAGPRGMRYVATSSQAAVGEYVDPEPGEWPDGWDVDQEAFKSGLDFSKPELQPGEVQLLKQWYERVCGEVPPYVAFLAKNRPHALKAYRSRWENAVKDGMPKQMMPYLQLHWNTARACKEGIREAALLARGFGMTDELIADAITWGMIYGGPSAVSIAAQATIGILDV